MKEKEEDREISVWLPLTHPLLGTWPPTQACALTGNRTIDLLIRRRVLSAQATELHQSGQKTKVLILPLPPTSGVATKEALFCSGPVFPPVQWRGWPLSSTLLVWLFQTLSLHEPLALWTWMEWGVGLRQFHCGDGKLPWRAGDWVRVWGGDGHMIPQAWHLEA